MAEFVAKLKQTPWIAHLMRAGVRFTSRLGNQFGAAITYFSVLAVVPVLMFAFAALGFTLTVLRPEWMQPFQDFIVGQLGGLDSATRDTLSELIDDFLTNWRGVGLVGLLSAMYSGAGWISNLKSAVRAQYRPDFDTSEEKKNIVVETLINFAILLGLLVLLLITIGIATAATTMGGLITSWLGLAGNPIISWLVTKVLPVIASVIAGWLLFGYLLRILPEQRSPLRVLAKAALIGAVGLGVLQYLSGFILTLFANNKAAALFGPVIIIMLYSNLFARLILFVAAWAATATQQAVSEEWQDIDDPLLEDPKLDITKPAEHAPLDDAPVNEDSAQRAWGRQRGAFVGPARLEYTEPDPNQRIPQSVAARGVRVGLGAGWITGAATGVGLGAGIAAFAAWLGRRRPR